MPDLIMLIGLQGSGKSTYRKKLMAIKTDYIVISLDDLLEEYALEKGISYNEVWKQAPMKDLNTILKYRLIEAINDKKDIIIDKTNMGLKVRRSVLSKLTSDYRKIAYVFVLPDTILKERLKIRESLTGKVIPDFAIDSVAKSYVAPTREEFDEIKYIRD